MKRAMFTVFAVTLFAAPLVSADSPIAGVWNTHTYVIEGEEYELDGIIIFTDEYFAGTGFARFTEGEKDDANANAGTYRIEGDNLYLQQQVQIHIRPGDEDEPIFYGKDVPEHATFEIEGDELTIHFPSGNVYRCTRLE